MAEVNQMSGTAAMFGAPALHVHMTRNLCKPGQKFAVRAAVPAIAAIWQRTAAVDRNRTYGTGGSLAQASSLR